LKRWQSRGSVRAIPRSRLSSQLPGIRRARVRWNSSSSASTKSSKSIRHLRSLLQRPKRRLRRLKRRWLIELMDKKISWADMADDDDDDIDLSVIVTRHGVKVKDKKKEPVKLNDRDVRGVL